MQQRWSWQSWRSKKQRRRKLRQHTTTKPFCLISLGVATCWRRRLHDSCSCRAALTVTGTPNWSAAQWQPLLQLANNRGNNAKSEKLSGKRFHDQWIIDSGAHIIGLGSLKLWLMSKKFIPGLSPCLTANWPLHRKKGESSLEPIEF